MKKLLFSALFLPGTLLAQKISLVSQDAEGCVISFSMDEQTIPGISINNQDYLDFNAAFEAVLAKAGAPALPVFGTTVQLPAQENVTVTLLSDETVDRTNLLVAPSKGSLKRNIDPASVAYTFGEAYTDNQFFPASPITENRPFKWRSMAGEVLTFTPYQYNPVTKTLRLHTHMLISVKYGNQQSILVTDPVLGKYQQRFVLNPVEEKYTPLTEQGEMLVVADPAYVSAVQSLVDWKNQKGIKTTIITTAGTGTTDSDVKQAIQDFYAAHPALMFVMLVGDHEQIPAHTYGLSDSEDMWSDSYYAQLSGGADDFYPEVYIGRLSGTIAQVELMANRIFEYEHNPAPGDWMEKAIGIGSNEGAGIGDDGEADWQHIRNLRTELMDFGYTEVYEFYDGSHDDDDAAGSPTVSMILPALDSGVGLLNYCGHGDLDIMYTSHFTSYNIGQATNAGLYPLVISVACNNGLFPGGTCISEAWLGASNAGQTTGAIAAAGSSILMAWAEPMQTEDEMAAIISDQYPDNTKETVGGLFYNSQMSMLETYPTETGIEVMETWVLFGDPSTVFRNKITDTITLSNIPHLADGSSSITVDCDVEGSLVAISQDNVLLGTATVSSPGSVTINFAALTNNHPVVVTATKQNYVCEQKSAQVGEGGLGLAENSFDLNMYPNPASDRLNIVASEAITNVRLTDLNGRLLWEESGASVKQVAVSHLPEGFYFVQLQTAGGFATRKISVRH